MGERRQEGDEGEGGRGARKKRRRPWTVDAAGGEALVSLLAAEAEAVYLRSDWDAPPPPGTSRGLALEVLRHSGAQPPRRAGRRWRCAAAVGGDHGGRRWRASRRRSAPGWGGAAWAGGRVRACTRTTVRCAMRRAAARGSSPPRRGAGWRGWCAGRRACDRRGADRGECGSCAGSAAHIRRTPFSFSEIYRFCDDGYHVPVMMLVFSQ